MKECNKKSVIIFLIIVILIVLGDLIMFYTSFQQDGIGRGFSRFWSQEK